MMRNDPDKNRDGHGNNKDHGCVVGEIVRKDYYITVLLIIEINALQFYLLISFCRNQNHKRLTYFIIVFLLILRIRFINVTLWRMLLFLPKIHFTIAIPWKKSILSPLCQH